MPTVTISKNTGADFAGHSDNEMWLGDSASNRSTVTQMESTKFAIGDWRITIQLFDTSSITGPVTVSAASFSLVCNTISGAGNTHDLRRVLRNAPVATMTWLTYDGTNNWSTGGCRGDGTDRVAASSASLAFSTTGTKTWTGLTSDVEAWINGTASAYGWALERSDGADDTHFMTFKADNGTDGERPSLSITYTAGVASNALRVNRLRPRIFKPGLAR